jgi:hypothetical protein
MHADDRKSLSTVSCSSVPFRRGTPERGEIRYAAGGQE